MTRDTLPGPSRAEFGVLSRRFIGPKPAWMDSALQKRSVKASQSQTKGLAPGECQPFLMQRDQSVEEDPRRA